MKNQNLKKPGSRGFSLVELLVAVLVGIILLGGLIQIFVMSRTSYRIQTNLNYMQENLRFASNQLSYSVRMSGFFHTIGDPGGAAIRVDASMPPPACGLSSWISPIRGFDGVATSVPTGLACLNPANYLPNTDVLVVTYAEPAFVYPAAVLAAVAADANVQSAYPISATAPYLMVYDKVYFPRGILEKGVIGNGTAIAALAAQDMSLLTSPVANAGRKYAQVNRSRLLRGAGMFPLAVDFYYIRRCSRLTNAAGSCDSNSDGGEPQPTLVRASLSANGTLVHQPIVEAVEQMQIEYLASGCPDFMGASQLTTANWGVANCVGTAPVNPWTRVIGVRINLLARSNVLENGYIDATPYRLSTDTSAYLAGAPATMTLLPKNSSFRRKSMTITALPRNGIRPLPN